MSECEHSSIEQIRAYSRIMYRCRSCGKEWGFWPHKNRPEPKSE